ncbi:MAG: ACT domain-containing protein [Peptococcaceae bacterium]|nr:ACT domain-containing protein [Peptococcaceae bacterium]
MLNTDACEIIKIPKTVDTLALEQITIFKSADYYTSIWVLVRIEDMEAGIRALQSFINICSLAITRRVNRLGC